MLINYSGVAYVIITKDELNLYENIFPISSKLKHQIFLIPNSQSCYICMKLEENGNRLVIFNQSVFPEFENCRQNYPYEFIRYIQQFVGKNIDLISDLELEQLKSKKNELEENMTSENFIEIIDTFNKYDKIINDQETLRHFSSIDSEIITELIKFKDNIKLSEDQLELVKKIEIELKDKNITYSGFQFIDQVM